MIKRNLCKYITFSLIIIGMLVCVLADSTAINAYGKSSDLFVNSNSITVVDNQTVPTNLKDKDGNNVATKFDVGRSGLLLTSNKSGSSVDFVQNIKGSFEVELRVYSDIYYYDATGKDYNSSTVTVNPYCDLQEFSIIFTAADGQKFEVIVAGGEKYNTITSAARVKIGESEFGYHYYTDDTNPKDTSLKNSGGYFTRIGGTTFSNITRRGDQLTSNSAPITIGFNAETMEVYCYHYGTSKTIEEGQYRVIADLNSSDIGLSKFENFDNYDVSFAFNSIAENKTAKMLIYSINGQALSGEKLVDTIGPNTIAKHKTNSVSGVKYYLPEISTYDLLESNNNFKTVVSIKDSKGSSLKLYTPNGEVITDSTYEKGCYFIPETSGEISISYTSYDSKGNAGKTSKYLINNFSNTPQIEFDYDGLENNYNLATKSLGDNLSIYPCVVTSSLFINGETQFANVSLYKDGSIIDGYNGRLVDCVENIKLEAGTYKLVYFINGFYNEEYSYEFTVVNTVPTVEFSSELLDKYICGETFDIPVAKYTLNGTTKRASAILYDPNGEYVDTSKEIVLDKIGTYKLTYMVNLDKTYSFDYYFACLHSVSGIFGEQKGVTIEYGNTGDLYKNQLNGVVLTYTKSDVEITYGKVLDLSTNTKIDSLIELITIPNEKGVADAMQYTIKLVDIHNPKNYVTITVYKGSWGNQWSYVKAGSSGQVLSGLENEKVLTDYETGAPVNFSMTGESIIGNEVLQLFYDNTEKGIYAANVKRSQYSYGNLIIDMDNKEYFSEKTLWDGFTTGEVYLTLSVQNLQTESAKILIKSINGVNFENEWIKDNDIPVITIDTFEYDRSNLPVGLINKEYNLYPAKAYDALDGSINYELSVYKDYQTANQKLVSTSKTSFTPTEAGNYTLVYSATDSSKNFAVDTVKITVTEILEELTYQFDNNLDNTIYVGEYLEIPTGVATGGSGNIEISTSLVNPEGEIVEIDTNDVFIDKVGKYTLYVTLIDYLGNEKVLAYDVLSSVSSNPIVSELQYNSTMIEGYEYDLSQFIALDYFTKNGISVSAIKSVEIIQNGETIKLDSSMKYIPNANTNGEEITIRFIAKNSSNDNTTVLEAKAHLLKVADENNSFNLANLFYQENIKEVNLQKDYVEYITDTDGAVLEYANYVIADGFSMKLCVNKDMNSFGAIQISLQDSVNKHQKIVFTIYKSGTSVSTATLNNIKNLSISSDFYQTTSQNFWFYFSAKSNMFVDGNTNKAISLVKNNLDGSVFEGFTSGKIKATIKFVDVVGNSAIRINSISNQAITNDTKDRIAPAIQIMGVLKNIGEINQPFNVCKAVASDGIDPTVKATVEIKKAGKSIYSGDANEDYEFHPSEYGVYTITYTAIDANKRKTSVSYLLTIKDRIKPELSVNGEVISEATVGKSYTLPAATATDNNDSELPIYMFIMAPDGEQRANQVGDYSFNPTLRGEYKITYYTYDSYNCYTYVEYIIKVK